MSFLDKVKSYFFEEVEEEEEEPVKVAKKIESIPKRQSPRSDEIEEPKFRNEKVEYSEKEEPREEKEKEIFKEEPIMEIPKEEQKKEKISKFPMMFEDDDFYDNSTDKGYSIFKEEKVSYDVPKENSNLYQGKKETSYIESISKNNEYTTTKKYYESHEKKIFKPSPIISPIYGILDKNYTKEEIVSKKETYVSARKKDLDSVRSKAFGENISKEEKKYSEPEEKKIYDVNNSKPSVNKVTLADAEEYYNDLGLAYNVDYSDETRRINNNSNQTRVNKHKDENKIKDENGNDNLFDLIDSMYNKED